MLVVASVAFAGVLLCRAIWRAWQATIIEQMRDTAIRAYSNEIPGIALACAADDDALNCSRRSGVAAERQTHAPAIQLPARALYECEEHNTLAGMPASTPVAAFACATLTPLRENIAHS